MNLIGFSDALREKLCGNQALVNISRPGFGVKLIMLLAAVACVMSVSAHEINGLPARGS
jgi:hypothetical protein